MDCSLVELEGELKNDIKTLYCGDYHQVWNISTFYFAPDEQPLVLDFVHGIKQQNNFYQILGKLSCLKDAYGNDIAAYLPIFSHTIVHEHCNEGIFYCEIE